MMHPMLNIAIKAARNASRVILRFMDHLDSIEISEKNRNDLVTEVDQLSEQEIIGTIREAYPEHAFIAEESGEIGEHEYCWIIDPLDGTTNYVHGFPQFCISIALRKKDQLEVGLVYDPIRNEMFTAIKGKGAKLNDKRIRVSPTRKLRNALIGTGFPVREHHHFKPYMQVFENLFPQTAGIRRAGAAALDLAYVAAGRLDGFWEAALRIWDIAAGVLLIQEAGGLISDFHGEDHYMDNGLLVAGNPKIHKTLLEIVASSIQE